VTQTVTKTTCPFCTLGCEIGIRRERNRFGNEYPDSDFNHGRVCPRGSLAARYLDFEKRLCYPRLGNHDVTWTTALEEVRRCLRTLKPDQIAVTFDKNLTIEEFACVDALVKAMGVSKFGSSYLEPEYYFNESLDAGRGATFEDLTKAEVFLLVGDVFAQAPVAAKFILDARYRRREHRIVTIDSVSSYTLSFGDVQLRVDPGTEPLILDALLKLSRKKHKEAKELCALARVDESAAAAAKGLLDTLNRGVVIGVMAAGKNAEPLAQAVLLAQLADELPGSKKWLPLAESLSFAGPQPMSEILAQVESDGIRAIVNFGDYFPFFYPQLEPLLKRLELIVTTSTLIPPATDLPMLVFPVASNLEKNGTIRTCFGPKAIRAVAAPVSGAKTIDDLAMKLARACDLELDSTAATKPADRLPRERLDRLVEHSLAMLKNDRKQRPGPRLVGEKTAFAFLDILEEPALKISRDLAGKLGLKPGGSITLQSGPASVNRTVQISPQARDDIVLISAESPANRGLFNISFDGPDQSVHIGPTRVQVWKKE